jgi:arylsulfatase A-like enzyme
LGSANSGPHFSPAWDSLSVAERRVRSKQMAVYAAMLENVDANIGRLISYLQQIGEADNTMIVVLSDNGADNNEQDKTFPDYYASNFDMSYEAMGLKGSYVNYGPGWAGASSTPLFLFKGSASEGGMRVPLIVHYPKGISRGKSADAFAYVGDLAPTMLELAGVPAPKGEHGGRKVESITGKSMLGLLRGRTDTIHGPDDVVAYELAGSAAVFRGEYKLMRNNPPFGDRKWRLIRYTSDPLELKDLAESEPERLKQMAAAYERYSKEVKLIEVPSDYHVLEQLQKNVERNQGKEKTDKVPVLD